MARLRRLLCSCLLALLLSPVTVQAAATAQHILPTSTTAGLPATCTDGAEVRVSDGMQGVRVCSGNAWYMLTGALNAQDFAGADMSAKINAAIAACPATGCVVDARGITGTQATATTIAITKPLHLIFGAVTLTSSAVPVIDLTVTGPPTATQNVWIQGSGIGVTNIIATGTGAHGIKALYGSFTIGAGGGPIEVSDLTLVGDSTGGAVTGRGLYIQGAGYLHNLLVKQWAGNGVHLDECIGMTVRDVESQSNVGKGFYVFRGNAIDLDKVNAYANVDWGVYLDATGGDVGNNGAVTLINSRVEANGTVATTAGGVYVGQKRNVKIRDNWIEDNYSTPILIAGTDANSADTGTISGNHILAGTRTVTGTDGIKVDYGQQFYIAHNWVEVYGGGGVNINLTANSTKNQVEWNYGGFSGGLIVPTDAGTANITHNPTVAGGLNVANGKNILAAEGTTLEVAFMPATSDGNDNMTLYFAGGGAASGTRGSYVNVTGNEFAGSGFKGTLTLEAGNSGEGGTWSDTIRGRAGNAEVFSAKAGNFSLVPAAIIANFGTGLTLNYNGSVRGGVYVGTADYTQCVSAATDCDVTVATLPAKTFVNRVIAELTVPYALGAAVLTGTLGRTAGGAEFLATFDADAAVALFGDADAELGSEMTAGARIANGATIPGVLAHWTNTTPLVYRLHSGSTNLGTGSATSLTAGSITFYFWTDRAP